MPNPIKPTHGPRVGRGAALQVRYRTYRTIANLGMVAFLRRDDSWADDLSLEEAAALEADARDAWATRYDLAAALAPDMVRESPHYLRPVF